MHQLRSIPCVSFLMIIFSYKIQTDDTYNALGLCYSRPVDGNTVGMTEK
jgi:hypothetical protein